MADEADSISVVGDYVWVQVPLPAFLNDGIETRNSGKTLILQGFPGFSFFVCRRLSWLKIPPFLSSAYQMIITESSKSFFKNRKSNKQMRTLPCICLNLYIGLCQNDAIACCKNARAFLNSISPHTLVRMLECV